MTKNLKRVVCSVLSAVLLFAPAAQAADAICQSLATIAFANGIQNTRPEAQASLDLVVEKTDSEKNPILLYHTKGDGSGTQGKLASFHSDVLEVYWLLVKETVGNDPEKEALAMAAFFKAVEPGAPEGFLSSLLAWLTSAENEVEAKAYFENTRDGVRKETVEDVAELKANLAAGGKILVLAHSQGTLYANAALEQLEAEAPEAARSVRLALAGAAASRVWQTPGSSAPNGYVTNGFDVVINTIRDFAKSKGLATPLVHNKTRPVSARDVKGHGFAEIYLDESDVGSAYWALISEGISALSGGAVLTYEVERRVGATAKLAFDAGLWKWSDLKSPYAVQFGPTVEKLEVMPGNFSTRTTYSMNCSLLGKWAPPRDLLSPSYVLPVWVPMAYGDDGSLIGGNLSFNGVNYPITQYVHMTQSNNLRFQAIGTLLLKRENGKITGQFVPEYRTTMPK